MVETCTFHQGENTLFSDKFVGRLEWFFVETCGAHCASHSYTFSLKIYHPNVTNYRALSLVETCNAQVSIKDRALLYFTGYSELQHSAVSCRKRIVQTMTVNTGGTDRAMSLPVMDSHKDAWVENNAEEISKNLYFTKLLHPIEVSSAIFGMFICKKCNGGNNSGRDSWHDLFKNTLIYTLLICMLLVVNCVRHLAAFWIVGSGDDLVFQILSSFWLVISTLNAILLVKSSHRRYGNYKTALQVLDTKILSQSEEIGIFYPIKKLRRMVKIVLIGVWIPISLTVVTLAIINFVTITPALEKMKELFIAPLESGLAAIILAFCVEILVSIAWGIPVPYCIIMCLVLKYAFRELTTHFSTFIKDIKSQSHEQLAKYRVLHLELCKCVNVVDKDLSCFFANWYIINIPQSCFISYILLNTDLDPISIAFLLYWLVTGLILVLVTSGFAASVHQEVSHVKLETLLQ